MRTTLDIDDDVLQAAKEIAANRANDRGGGLSELARKGLTPASGADRVRLRNGVPILPGRPGGPRPTMRLVNELRDQP